jgi:hypothetical protein
MGRALSAVWLLTLVACASEPPAQPPAAAPPAQAAPVPLKSGAPTASGDYAREVDDLLRTLTGAGAPDSPRDEAPSGAPRRVVDTIAPVSPAIAEASSRAARAAAYEENLATCLDGRFSAFCDHAQLARSDAARVRQAEHEANLATCIDPEWQHLCRPELLPEAYEPSGGTPIRGQDAGGAPAVAPTGSMP